GQGKGCSIKTGFRWSRFWGALQSSPTAGLAGTSVTHLAAPTSPRDRRLTTTALLRAWRTVRAGQTAIHRVVPPVLPTSPQEQQITTTALFRARMSVLAMAAQMKNVTTAALLMPNLPVHLHGINAVRILLA